MRVSFAYRGVALFALACALGCGGTEHGSGFQDGGNEDGTSGKHDATTTDVGSFPDVPSLGETSTGGEGGSTLGCSSDLQSVINGSGVVVQKCPPDEGCAGGMCVAACQAAAANKGTIGCDFVVATPSFYPSIRPPCFAIFLANNWGKAVTVEVTRAGTSYDSTTFGLIPVAGMPATSWAHISGTGVPAGQVGILFMSQDPASSNETPLTCPITPAISATEGTAVVGTGIGSAWHIVTDVPVTAYDILPYGGADSYLPSAELLIPTTAWTTNYFGIVPYRGSSAPQWGQVVAMQDGTEVKVVPNVSLPAGTGVAAAPVSALTEFSLMAGQYIQWQDSMEMSSTVIQANYPIGFSGGLGYDCYTSATSSGGGCDSAHQQIPPITALGFDYVAPPFATRLKSLAPESIPYRIVGAVDGTTLTYDPPDLMSTMTAQFIAPPTTLTAGQVVDFQTTLAFEVKSQDANHPFYVGQIMPGCEVIGGNRGGCNTADAEECCLGDEEYVNILPPAQFLQKYIFFTDVTYATTNLVFTRSKGTTGFQDVTLDCAGTLTGWQPVGTAGLYEVTNVDLVRGEVPNGTCNNGPHTASSPGPFGVMVWGLDYFSSYAYPAGGNVAAINTVVVPPIPK